jgi:hypothetical protein
LAGVIGTGLIPLAANAAPVALQAEQTAAMTSSFTLDFGGYGRSEASISHTQFELNLDPDGGLARFDAYDQDIAPLDLFGFNTGDIRVEIVPGSSAGTFNPLTREFETTEEYAIHFEGDLGAFGLTSPVVLPSASRGTLSVSEAEGGRVVLDWSGVGQLPNPFDPSAPAIIFNYTCSMQAAFASDPAALVNLGLMPNVINMQLPILVETKLMTKLDRAAANIDAGAYRSAILPLTAFIQLVEAQRGKSMSDAEADLLHNDAQGAIDKLQSASDPTHDN